MKKHRSPGLAATPVLPPGSARTAGWVGLGAVAPSRGIGWRSGLAAVLGEYFNRHVLRDPCGHYYYDRGALYSKGKENTSCEIEDSVETHRCKLGWIVRSRVLRVLCDLNKDVF